MKLSSRDFAKLAFRWGYRNTFTTAPPSEKHNTVLNVDLRNIIVGTTEIVVLGCKCYDIYFCFKAGSGFTVQAILSLREATTSVETDMIALIQEC